MRKATRSDLEHWETNEAIFNTARTFLKPATHLAILYAHRGEFDRQRKS